MTKSQRNFAIIVWGGGAFLLVLACVSVWAFTLGTQKFSAQTEDVQSRLIRESIYRHMTLANTLKSARICAGYDNEKERKECEENLLKHETEKVKRLYDKLDIRELTDVARREYGWMGP